MHVMLVAPEDLPIPAERGGSVQIYLQQLCAALSGHIGITLTLVSPGKPSKKLPMYKGSTHVAIDKRGEAYWHDVKNLITKTSPDVLQIDNRPFQAYTLKQQFKRIPVVLNLHSLTFLGPKHIRQSRVKQVLRNMDAIVCNSRSLKETICRRYHIQQTEPFHVIYPGVQPPSQSMQRSYRTKPHVPLKLLFVGRVIEQKGVDIAIQTARLLQRKQQIELTIVGRTPPWEKAYANRVKQLSKGVNVRFVGFMPPNKLGSVYQNHDILICPSQRHEAFGLVNLEAMQHGLPVVASHIGGIPEAVGNRGGKTVRSYTKPSAFADAILEMQREKTYQSMSKYAVSHAKKFTWKETGKQFAKVYRMVR